MVLNDIAGVCMYYLTSLNSQKELQFPEVKRQDSFGKSEIASLGTGALDALSTVKPSSRSMKASSGPGRCSMLGLLFTMVLGADATSTSVCPFIKQDLSTTYFSNGLNTKTTCFQEEKGHALGFGEFSIMKEDPWVLENSDLLLSDFSSINNYRFLDIEFFPDSSPNALENAALEEPFFPNDLLLTENGEETTEWRYELIRNAKESLEISGNFGGGEVFQKTLEEIDQAMNDNENLRTTLIFADDFIKDPETNALNALKAKYGTRFNFSIFSRSYDLGAAKTYENHVKISVADGQYWIIGGTGITDGFVTRGDVPPPKREAQTYAEMALPLGNRDSDLVGHGKETGERARAEFFKLEKALRRYAGEKNPESLFFPISGEKTEIPAFQNAPRLRQDRDVKLLSCGIEQKHNLCTEQLSGMIAGLPGKEPIKITLAHMYQNFVGKIDKALTLKASEGVPILIITAGAAGNSPIKNAGMVSSYKQLFGEGVETYYYDVPDILYHKKIVVVEYTDGSVCTAMGSYNLGFKSDAADHEILAIVCESKGNRLLADDMDHDLEVDRKLSRREQSELVEDIPSYLYYTARSALFRVIRVGSSNTLGRAVV